MYKECIKNGKAIIKKNLYKIILLPSTLDKWTLPCYSANYRLFPPLTAFGCFGRAIHSRREEKPAEEERDGKFAASQATPWQQVQKGAASSSCGTLDNSLKCVSGASKPQMKLPVPTLRPLA